MPDSRSVAPSHSLGRPWHYLYDHKHPHGRRDGAYSREAALKERSNSQQERSSFRPENFTFYTYKLVEPRQFQTITIMIKFTAKRNNNKRALRRAGLVTAIACPRSRGLSARRVRPALCRYTYIVCVAHMWLLKRTVAVGVAGCAHRTFPRCRLFFEAKFFEARGRGQSSSSRAH